MTGKDGRFGTFSIGGHETGRLWLAPMAGYTDIAFRELCKAHGAGLTVTEMVSVRGIVRGNAATKELERLSPLERPSCVQLFGSDPADFERAAKLVECDIIDINMGCPMPKIVKNGDGSALLRDPGLAGEIVSAVRAATDRPVTVKTRLGYGTGEKQAETLIARVAAAGASAVTLHGRYAEQRYAGRADIDEVARIASSAPVPVVYNGDACADNIDRLLSMPFAAVAIGRAALKDPGVFSGERLEPISLAREYTALLNKYFDERYSVDHVRKLFVHFFAGVPGGRAVRERVNCAHSLGEVYAALDAFCA